MEQNNNQSIPCLPENAPFTPEQRAYLNGFLAGIFSRMPAPAGLVPPAAPAEKLLPLCVLFGSQTGNAEGLAKRIAKEAGKRGFAATINDLGKYPNAQLATEERVLIVTSTFGDGEPPDNAKAFWNFLNGATAPILSKTRFSICAIGDSNYPKFCGFGKDLDARLQSLGAERVHPRADCDLEFDEPFGKWLNLALEKIGSSAPTAVQNAEPNDTPPVSAETISKYSRLNPFLASLITNRRLNGPGSEKDTRHFEIGLEGSDLQYEAGDALGVVPLNCPEMVDDLLGALKFSGAENVPEHDGEETSLREALLRHYEITRIPQSLLKAVADESKDETLNILTSPDVNGELSKFLWGREIIDLLLAHPMVKFTPSGFVSSLKKLQPRLYSISSSPKEHPNRVHLTVNVVRFESLARNRKGVCSTFLADRVEPTAQLPIFVHKNKNFRPPSDQNAPMIMIGPGTGIAPFRAFLQERRASGAMGKNWLFYGDQRSATDFMYRDELESMQQDGTLNRFDTAFSRDQAEKVYVQNRMREHAREVYEWLETGAHFYVCGDAKRMAKDVDVALHEIIQTAGGHTNEQATEYIDRLKLEKRYQRDVY
jgi:sulfite reductase (NADPH) flavoprotein alpha-component